MADPIVTVLYSPSEIQTRLEVGQGPAGTPGISPPGADLNYTYVQATPSDDWTIVHGLSKNPSVTVIDSSGAEVEGSINYPTLNTVRLVFSAPFSGTAYLN